MSLALPIDRDSFLRDYWQKQPLLMPGAMNPKLFSVPPDELAGLACEADIESRLVIQHGERDWTVEHGPFEENRFAELPLSNWTLLVQDVDKHRDDVAALLDHFDFVPGWRIDDIMISFATEGGGVGPHTDSYDVFLMQAQGRRRWRINATDYSDDDLLLDQPLRILSNFETTEDWLLEPGDVLYLPPGVAHWGTAEGDCMTYSLGFRAPQQQELLAEWLHHCSERIGSTPLVDQNEGRSPPGTLARGFVDLAKTLCLQPQAIAPEEFTRWLGRYVTEPKPQFQIAPLSHPISAHELENKLAAGHSLRRHPWARLCWTRMSSDGAVLFGNGVSWECRPAIESGLELLCGKRCLAAGSGEAQFSGAMLTLVLELVNAGLLELSEKPCR